MKALLFSVIVATALSAGSGSLWAATHYVVTANSSPAPPYTNWTTAATNIQQAIDSAAPGDEVVVTNGIYASGSRDVQVFLGNRVAVTTPLVLRSVNGPQVTIIDAGGAQARAKDPHSTNRCVYLVGGATLSGFTLTNATVDSGGGVLCFPSNAIVTNCVLTGNSALYYGAGASDATLFNCVLTNNSANLGSGAAFSTLFNCNLTGNSAQTGGGAAFSTLYNCTVSGNSASDTAAGAYNSGLINCAVIGNSAGSAAGGVANCTNYNCTISSNSASTKYGGAVGSIFFNSIVYFNTSPLGTNYDTGSVFNYCCVTPVPPGGIGNIGLDPQFASPAHLSAGSPCRGAGNSAYASGTDIDGESWNDPPSIGCDEYYPAGALSVGIQVAKTNVFVGEELLLKALIGGKATKSDWSFGDNTSATNQIYINHSWANPGTYQVVLRAFNDTHQDGVTTNLMISVTQPPTFYVDAAGTNSTPPYDSWAKAATNIQDAVDAAPSGSLVLVTNGLYNSGGRAGALTNAAVAPSRVIIDKDLLVQSVNGPLVTIVAGAAAPGGGDGVGAVRCVSIGATNAVLSGFTLTNGHTRDLSSFGQYLDLAGGGVCSLPGTPGLVTNCVIAGNSARYGGGVAYAVLKNCSLNGNWSDSSGGGAFSSTLTGCTLTRNCAQDGGGGAVGSTLISCALSGNSAGYGGGASASTLLNCNATINSASQGGGVYGGTLYNSIVYFNTATSGSNYYAPGFLSFNYCCTFPRPDTGIGNIDDDPQLADASHLFPTSPCRGAGTYISGDDIDGEPWATPPSIGCDEFYGAKGPLTVSIAVTVTNVAVGTDVGMSAIITGRASATSWDLGDGIVVSNRFQTARSWAAPGDYQVTLTAYNDDFTNGISATQLIRVLAQPTLYVVARSTNPVPPYTSWATAAATIQDAVDAADLVGGISLVLVSNGVYSTGGGVGFIGSSNRVNVSKPLILRSVSGPEYTIIDGRGSVGCVLLTNGASLAGFTLTNGSGGVYCYGNASVSNCVIIGNTGTAAAGGSLYGCALIANWGLGVSGSTLYNCTLADNAGGGVSCCTLYNCIVYFNTNASAFNYDFCSSLSYCCATPVPPGIGNIDLDPQLVSAYHLSAASPCRGAGTNAIGTDIDGETWSTPPSIGCDEYPSGALSGPLNVAIGLDHTQMTAGYPVSFIALIGGQASLSVWDFGDGTLITNRAYISHTWTNPGDYKVVLTAYNDTWPGGTNGTTTIHVIPSPVHYVALGNSNPQPPYTSWATAATNIQDAVDAAILPGASVLVSNGVYATGGRVVFGTITNRVVVNRPIKVQSLNGLLFTIIEGTQIPGTTNGDGAIRCVYLSAGASLSGFTLTNGATLTTWVSQADQLGGGVWCESPASVVSNCMIVGNSATDSGGGSYGGTLNNCILRGNSAQSGGGAYLSVLNNCALSGNSAQYNGGGAFYGTLNNCTVTGNSAQYGGGVSSGMLNNCILYFNTATQQGANYDYGTFKYCCTTPLPFGGTNNISTNPQLASASHLSAGSPCRGAGSSAFLTGTDIDGEPWANPPTIGCDEFYSGGSGGTLIVGIAPAVTNVASGYPVGLTALVQGPTTSSAWDFGDGTSATNQPYLTHAWAAPGDYTVSLRAYNSSQPAGVSATVVVHIINAVHYVSTQSSNPVAPYSSWSTAATNIQDAVDAAAVVGALVLVGDGTYASGGRAVFGLMTNRLVLDKPLRVQSLNGPSLTVIQGQQVPGSTNGDGAIRCVYLSGGAILSGFTLTNGATRNTGNYQYEEAGGGVYCDSPDSVISNCVVVGNSAQYNGGGAYGGMFNNCTLNGNSAQSGGGTFLSTLDNCTLNGNSAQSGGGGAYFCVLNNCTISGNSAQSGGGASGSTLNNCTLTSNSAQSAGGGAYSGVLNNCTMTGNSAQNGGGISGSTLNNCIVYFNKATQQGANYDYGSFNYCCTTPLPFGGPGNISADPQLASASHLSTGSPCRGAGSPAFTSGTDIDGESWASPPSIGCDEVYFSVPGGPLIASIGAAYTNVALGYSLGFTALIQGDTTASSWDFGDGTSTTNQPYVTHAWAAPGDYTVSLRAYNPSQTTSVSSSILIHVINAVHYVSAQSPNPVAPYNSWATAAKNIQDAVDAAEALGALVLVGDGTYAASGRAVFGSMTNRLVLDKPLRVQSLNGPSLTVIQGQQVPGITNGDSAVRCVYLTAGSILSGFTLTNGATRNTGDYVREQAGGGLYCESLVAIVSNCVIVGNSAQNSGGGAYGGTFDNCVLSGNWAQSGGGAYQSTLDNCTLSGNYAQYSGGGTLGGTLNNCILNGNWAQSGGGASSSTLNNCTVTTNSAQSGGGAFSATLNNCVVSGNSAQYSGGGAYYGTLNNCTVTGNSAQNGGGVSGGAFNNCIIYFNTSPEQGTNYDFGFFNYCCTTPPPVNGTNNISADPQLASASHLSAASPCRGAGNSLFVSGLDIDGQPWANPPSIGCDEFYPGVTGGPLIVAISAAYTNVAPGYPVGFTALIQGQTTASTWDFGEGTPLTNQPYATHTWAAPGDYTVTLRAYNGSQPAGVSATITIHVISAVYYVSAQSANPVAPYSSWATAARNIQDAVDAAGVVGALVIVGDGTYTQGGRAVAGAMTNRVAITKPLRVQSLNGPSLTIIQGQQVPGITNGDGAIRCVYLAGGAGLSGFTLTSGATRNQGDYQTEQSGGGVYCESLNALVSNCVIVRNSAQNNGGGAFGGTFDNCVLSGNWAQSGGGAYQSTLNNCAFSGNYAQYSGGGTLGGTLNSCILNGNWAQSGGGANSSTLNNSMLTTNSAQSGAGVSYGTLNSCVLNGNAAQYNGGGAYYATLNNCTVSGNTAAYGGGISGGTLNNCIVYFNTATQQGTNYDFAGFNYCCTTPQPPFGTGNITNDPLFVNLAGGDFHLESNSPCIDAGTSSFVISDTDLDGNPRIAGASVDIGAYEFQINAPPVITAQPQSLTVPANSSPALSVVARGTPPFYYQWQRHGADLIDGGHLYGVNAATLIFTNVLGADAGDYSVVVTNAFGSVQSQSATLVVLDPFITTQPTNQVVKLGGSVTLQVTAAGTPPLSYTWRKEGTPLAGALQPLLMLTNTTVADAGFYDVVVTNAYGSITSSVARLQLDFAVADSFNPGVGGGGNPSVYCLCIQPDGKILVAGTFTTLAGQSRTNLGRLNPDGTLDSSFDPQVAGGVFPAVNTVVVEPSGDILVGGRFSSLGGLSRDNLGRLHADGTVDATFNPGATGTVVDFANPEVDCIALNTNGQILVAGTFNTLGGQKRLCLGRLNSDGSLDPNFNPGADYIIQTLTVQADGRILVSGKFNTLAGASSTNIGRINADGSFDNSFQVQVFGGGVVSMAVQPDAKLLLAGTFDSLGGQPRKGLGRVNPDGSLDPSFTPAASGSVWCVAQQADGRILAGGIFFPISGQGNLCLVRLKTDGTLDGSFNPQVSGTFNPQSTPVVLSLALQDDGKLLVGGSFTNLSGQARSSLGRLLTIGDATQTLSFSPTAISWLRGGAGPEVWSTTFDYSTNGSNWSSPLAASRIAGGWQVSGLALPPQAKVRARGLVAGGYGGRSGWFVESATGGPPRFDAVELETTGFSLMFQSQTGFSYSVEYRDDLATGAWKLLEQRLGSGLAETVTDPAAATAVRFYRLRVGSSASPP